MSNNNYELYELVEAFMSQKRIRLEGERGVEGLNKLTEALGYNGTNFMWGSSLETFLADNPGAMEALVEWIMDQHAPEWVENLESEVELEDEEE
jgi:hypothetical protein